MTVDDPFNLRPIWDATLDIYKEIAKVCDRHGLRYYVTDGTLIGVVRHKGFIPWDDDFDMSMPRPDYEKFIGYAKTELPPHLKFVNWKNTPEFHLMFGKIQDCRRERIEAIEAEVGHELSNGLFIDVFPIEGYPESKFELAKFKIWDFVIRQIMAYRFGKKENRSWIGKMLHPLGALIAFCMPHMRIYSDFQGGYEKWLLRYPFEDSRFTGRASLCLHEFNRPPLLKDAWGSGKIAEFYGGYVRIPSDYAAYLTPLYGDYMKLPPPEKRHPTHTYAQRCPWWLGPTNSKAE